MGGESFRRPAVEGKRPWRLDGRELILLLCLFDSFCVSLFWFAIWIRQELLVQVEEYVRTTGAQKGDKWRLFKHKSGQVEKSFKAAEKAGFKQCVAEDVD